MRIVLATLTLALATAPLAAQPATQPAAPPQGTVPLKKVEPKADKLLINGKTPAEVLAAHPKAHFESTSVEHYRYVAYSNWVCDADWDQNCEGSVSVDALPGYQVCKVLYRVTTSDGHDAWFNATPAQFYPSDPQSPDRFRSYTFQIHAFGNGNAFDHRGSKEVVEDIGMDLIPADADDFTRYYEGCYMPAHD